MTYKEFISKSKEDRNKILDEVSECGDYGVLFHLVYSYLHYEHKEFNPKFCNKALKIKASNILGEDRVKLLREI